MANQATIVRLCKAVYETVAEVGSGGAPAGVIYAAMMGAGVDLETYQTVEGLLVRSKLLRKEGQLLFANPLPKAVKA